MPLYNRVASLIIGQGGKQGKELSGLRFSFSIEKGSTKSPNKCSLKIYNMAESTRKLVEVIGNVCILKAGYADDVGPVQIFTGNIIRYVTVRENADWITEIEMQDGFIEYRDSKISVTYAKGATVTQVVTDLSKKFDLPVRKLPDDIAAKQYPSGFAFVGRVRDAMDKACQMAGLDWSIQGREIQVVKKGGAFKKTAIVLSSYSGMLGSPAQDAQVMTEKAAAKIGYTKKSAGVRTLKELNRDGVYEENLQVLGFKVNSLLQPTVEPGALIQVKSKGIDGEFFKVETLLHVGDTHGQDWSSQFVLRYV